MRKILFYSALLMKMLTKRKHDFLLTPCCLLLVHLSADDRQQKNCTRLIHFSFPLWGCGVGEGKHKKLSFLINFLSFQRIFSSVYPQRIAWQFSKSFLVSLLSNHFPQRWSWGRSNSSQYLFYSQLKSFIVHLY